MKIKQTLAILAVAVLAINTFGQGTTIFNNGSGSRVILPDGSYPGQGILQAGLYYSISASDLPGPTPGDELVATDNFVLSPNSVTPVTTGTLSSLQGRFSASTIEVLDAQGNPLSVGTIYVQARIWSLGYDTYADAVLSGNPDALVGVSNLGTTPITLATGTQQPTPTANVWSGPMAMVQVPEPSTVILGVLGGLGALVLLRRRS